MVKYHACAFFHKAISVRNRASIRDVAPLRIEPLIIFPDTRTQTEHGTVQL